MRKKPLQKRSKETVDALIEATARTIAERGIVDTTTNHIAACAGIGIGSLYEYFSNKEELVDALLDRVTAELAEVIDRELALTMDADAHTATRHLLTAVFDFMERRGSCHLELVRHWQSTPTTRTITVLERHMLEACRQYLMRHHDEIRVADPGPALFVVITSTLYTVVHYLSQPQPYLARAQVIDALSDMIAAYLASGQPPAKPTRASTKRARP
jgi:AcrR family transcriptional regulator